MDFEDLPEVVGFIAQVIGRDRALYLAGQLNRGLLTIPATPTENHKIVQILGMADARKLSNAYPRWVVRMPNCWQMEIAYRHKCMHYLYSQGATMEYLAELFIVSKRNVRYVLNSRRITDGF